MSRRPPAPRGLGTLALLRRQVLTDRGAVLTVAGIVLVTAALAAAVPRLLDALQTDGARTALAQTGPLQRDLAAVAFAAPPVAPGGDPFAPTRALLDDTAADLPPVLARRVREPAYAVDFRELTVRAVTPRVDAPADNAFLELTVQSDLDDHVRYVEGGPPQRIAVAARDDALPADEGRVLPRSVTHRGVLDVAVSARTAQDIGLRVGSAVRIAELDLTLQVVGLFEPVDAQSPYWGFDTRVLRPQQNYSSSLGVYYTGVAAVAEQAYPELEVLLAGVRSPVTLLRLPVDEQGLDGVEVPPLLGAAHAAEAATVQVPPRERPDGQPPAVQELASFRLATDLDDVLSEHLRQRRASTAVVSLVVTGLLGVAVAVLALAGRLVVERRQRSLALAVARGASPAQLRVLMALEGAVLGGPAALAGCAVAATAVPGRPGPWGLALPLLLGVAPVVLLPVLARPGRLRAVRRDVGSVRSHRLRLAAEAGVVLAAAAAVALLRSRGSPAGGRFPQPGATADGGIDPLLAATPLLLALAGALLLARAYPVPLARLATALSRRRGAVSFLGAARASRDAPAGTLPLVVLLLALATAVFGTVVSATTAAGARLAATQAVGADARLSSLGFDEADLAAAEDVDGVAAAAGLVQAGVEVATGTAVRDATLVAADAEALSRVQAGVPGTPRYPRELWTSAERVPVVVEQGLAAVGEELTLGQGPASVTALVVGTGPANLPSVQTARPWLVVDRALLLDAGGEAPLFDTALLDLVDPAGTDPRRAEQGLRVATGTTSPLLTLTGAVERAREAPLAAGTLAAFPVAAAVAAALSALAVVLTLVVTAPARGRLLSRLRTLGLSPRQAQGLAVWEVAPLAVAALAAGLLLGLAVPWLVAPAVDLTPFTGGSGAPPYTVSWPAVALVAAGFAGVIGGAVAVSVAANRRLRLGAVLRVGEEQ